MNSPARRHRLPATAALLSTTLLFSGCSAPWSDTPTESFISLVNEGDWAGAAGQTDDPGAAESYLTGMDASVGETSVQLDVDDGRTTATWTVPSGDEVTSEGSLSTTDDDTVDGRAHR